MIVKYTVILIVWVLIFHLWGLKELLLELSIKTLPSIKKDQSFGMWLLAVVGGEIGQSWALAIGRYYLRKDQGLIVLTALCLGNALNSILKTFWHEPRPFFVSDLIIPARCSNFEYGLPSGHTMGTLLVWRTLLKLFDGGFKTQSTIYTCIFFISYNRAQQQVHSFDQLLDGFVMGFICSEILTEPRVQKYFFQLVENMPKHSFTHLLNSKLCKVYYASQIVYLCCFLFIDHTIPDDQLAIVKTTCGVDVSKFYSLYMTLGVNLYSVSILTSLWGMWLTRNDPHTPANIRSISDFFKLQRRALPCWGLLVLWVPSWKEYSMGVRLIMKCMVPCCLLNFYTFCLGEKWDRIFPW